MASPQLEHGYFRIARELHMAICRTRVPGEARQMWDAIFSQTFGFQKKNSEIPTVQIMEITGMTRLAVYRSRKKLIDMNMITIYKNVDSQILTYSIQKDYDKWRLSTKKETVYKKETKYLQKSRQSVSKKVDTLIVKDNLKIIKDTSRKTWLTPFAKVWQDVLDGEFPFGEGGKAIKQLLKKHNQEKICLHLKNYLESVGSQFVNITKFSHTFGTWEKKGGNRGNVERSSARIQPEAGKYKGISKVIGES